jgi:hypothetical protein
MPPIRGCIMKKILVLLFATVAMQFNCGTAAANISDTSQFVGDFPTNLKKGIYYA